MDGQQNIKTSVSVQPIFVPDVFSKLNDAFLMKVFPSFIAIIALMLGTKSVIWIYTYMLFP